MIKNWLNDKILPIYSEVLNDCKNYATYTNYYIHSDRNNIYLFKTSKNALFCKPIFFSSMEVLLELLKYTVPAIIVLISSYLIVKKFLVTELQRKQIALLHETQDVTIRLRLQAYERLILFVERLHPRQLIPRVYEPGMSVVQLQYALIQTIRAEFEHNLSQQMYVSNEVWQTIRGVKEQELNMITHIAKQLDPEASGKDLHTSIVNFVLTTEDELPVDVALQVINREAKRVMSLGATA